MRKANTQGFTLIELLIVISVTIILAASTIPVYGGWQSMSQLNESKAQIVQMIRMARQYSIAGYNDTKHGVYLEINPNANDKAIYYQGDSYASRDSDYDLELLLDNTISITTTLSGQEVNFTKNNGLPSSQGIINIFNNINNSYQLEVNEIGVVF